MSNIRKTKLPKQSLLHSHIKNGDFLDCYLSPCAFDVDKAATLAMDFPFWAKALLSLRNIIMAPFGIKTTTAQSPSIGAFPITERNQDEIIMGFDDRHLDFRISVLVKDKHAYGATWVRTHNFFGRCYLTVIMPFHILIMRNAMKSVDNQRQKQT